MFADRLNFLMSLTHTSNNALAGKLNLTASYISRLRNGRRNLPKKPEFVTTMAAFFAKNITSDEQKNTLERMLRVPSGYPADMAQASELIFSWLITETDDDSLSDDYVSRIGKYNAAYGSKSIYGYELEGNTFLYTLSEKKAGLTEFMKTALNAEKPGTMLLFSDEVSDWVYSDSVSNEFVNTSIATLIDRGWKIKLIYSLNNNYYEFTRRLYNIIPFVATGQVERFFCTRIYQTITRRGLFIIPGIVALSVNSVESTVEGMPAVFTRDKAAVKALENEFNAFLDFCEPLGTVFSSPFYQNYWTSIHNFAANPANLIMHTRSVSAFFVPRRQVETISVQANNPKFIEIFDKSRRSIEQYLKHSTVCEFISLPTCDELFEGKVPYTFDDLVADEYQYYYTPADFAEHLRAIIEAKKNHAKYYNVYIAPSYMKDFTFLVKENCGYYIRGYGPSGKVFYVTEKTMVSHFWGNFFGFVSRLQPFGQDLAVYEMERLIGEIEARLGSGND